jgi:surface polysaccharide O-acyltransferase-like enzyme
LICPDLLQPLQLSISIAQLFGLMKKYSWVQIINSISRFALPMFFFLSGYSLTFSDMSKQRTYSLKSFLKHRSKKILVPFIIWSTVYEFELYLIYNYFKVSAQNEFANFDFKSVLITIVTGNSKYHLYFIVVLIQLYIIYWILFNMKIYSKVSFVAISFGITIIATLLSYTTQNDGLIVHYSFLPWLFYFAFGMWLASNKHNGKKYLKTG